MANQPTHEWKSSIYHDAEKTSKDTITLARRVIKNQKSSNPQILQLEDPETTVTELSALTCTLLDIVEDQGVTPEMVARLMGKLAGGPDHAIHRLLPQVKKEIKLELKESKSLTIPRLDQKKSDIAAGKRHPKAKGKGQGPKSSRESTADVDEVEVDVREDTEHGTGTPPALDMGEDMERWRAKQEGNFKLEKENQNPREVGQRRSKGHGRS